MNFNLDVRPQAEKPLLPGDYVLYNQCDGYHLAEAHFDPDGSFAGFFSFMGQEFDDDTYVAWARLPDTEGLYEIFADKPHDGLSAHEVTLERIKRQEAKEAQPRVHRRPFRASG